MSRNSCWLPPRASGALLACNIVLPGGDGDGGNLECILDYDECIDLGLDADLCQSIYESCEGEGEDGGEDGDGGDDGDSCWDDVQECIEAAEGDEDACADVIDECSGGDEGGDDGEPPPPSCWDEVETCYEDNPDSDECQALADECAGSDDGGDPDDCDQAYADCAEMNGENDPTCWANYEECTGGGDNGCDDAYQECVEAAGDDPDLQSECELSYGRVRRRRSIGRRQRRPACRMRRAPQRLLRAQRGGLRLHRRAVRQR